MSSKQIVNLSDLKADDHNANKGTPRGKEMIESSLRRVGAGRSIVVDKDGRIIAGNKTAEQWASIADSGDIQVIQTDGSKLVVVQRTDLDLADTNSTTARELAYYDNRASEVSLMWDAEVVLADLATDIPMKDIFQDGELDELIKSLGYEDPTTAESNYSRKIVPPVYEPQGPKPNISDLYDKSKSESMIKRIDESDLPDDEKEFLRFAAYRHTSFRFDRIAEYYAHSEESVQSHMEESALVIIDFDKAIELGFVRMSTTLAEIAGLEDKE